METLVLDYKQRKGKEECVGGEDTSLPEAVYQQVGAGKGD